MPVRCSLLSRAGAIAAAACVFASAATTASGQEAMYTEAATMPGVGSFILRQQIHVTRTGTHPLTNVTSATEVGAMTSLQYGVARGVSLRLDVPIVLHEREELSDGADETSRGVNDLDLMLKVRLYRSDSGGVDTVRIALLAGAAVASGDSEEFSTQSVNPMLGIVYTQVLGRHGYNLEATYRFNTGGDNRFNTWDDGEDDALKLAAAYLYRIAPARYSTETIGAWYVVTEFINLYETNGDIEGRFSPGIMYEGRRWGAEAMIALPVYDELDERPELDWEVGGGLRFLF